MMCYIQFDRSSVSSISTIMKSCVHLSPSLSPVVEVENHARCGRKYKCSRMKFIKLFQKPFSLTIWKLNNCLTLFTYTQNHHALGSTALLCNLSAQDCVFIIISVVLAVCFVPWAPIEIGRKLDMQSFKNVIWSKEFGVGLNSVSLKHPDGQLFKSFETSLNAQYQWFMHPWLDCLLLCQQKRTT